MSKIRLGFVGVGLMGQAAHLRNYLTEADCEVVAIAEMRPHLREAVKTRYAIPHGYGNHREMIAAQRLDGIVASQHYGIHGQLVPELLAAGVPVLTEKPICRSSVLAAALVEASKASAGKLYIGYHKRCDPATVHAKRLIEELRGSGEIGRLRYVRVCIPPGDWVAEGFSQNIATSDPLPSLASDPEPAGMDPETIQVHNTFINGTIHQVNLLRHLFGEGYAVRYADAAGVLMAVTSHSGIPGMLEMAPYQTTVDWHEHAMVCFERGYVRIDLPAPLASNRPGALTVFKDPGQGAAPSTIQVTLPWVHAMRNQARQFIRVCRGEASELSGAEDALEDMHVADCYIRMLTDARQASAMKVDA